MLKLRDLMSTDLLTVGPETSVERLLEIMARRRVSGLPVVDEDGSALGVVSSTDIVRFFSKSGGADEEEEALASRLMDDLGSDLVEQFWWEWAEAGALPGLTRDRARETRVSEIMTPMAYTLEPNTPVTEAAGAMYRGAMHRVLVTEEGKLVGIVTTTDIVQAVADGRLHG